MPGVRPVPLGEQQEVSVSVLRQLYQLQLVDSEHQDKSRQLAMVNAGLGESDEVIRAQEAVGETETSLGQLKVQLRALEIEIAGVSAKLKQNQDRLYSGRVRNPKELSNLQEEAAALRRRRSELEDGQLDLMISIEEAEAELAERQARFNQIEAAWRDEQARLQADKDDLELRLLELEEQRDGMRPRIGAADLDRYDGTRSRLGGTAVARLKKGICTACGVDVPTSMARAVERGDGMHDCPICGRILFGG
jgi:predicted  nucleic acid-binding Zn-ribbon protein